MALIGELYCPPTTRVIVLTASYKRPMPICIILAAYLYHYYYRRNCSATKIPDSMLAQTFAQAFLHTVSV